MTIKEIRNLLGISRAEFSRRYKIPIRTLENWETEGDNHREPPEWALNLLERVVREDAAKQQNQKDQEDDKMNYYVYELNYTNKILLGTFDSAIEAARFADQERKRIRSGRNKDGIYADVSMVSSEELERDRLIKEVYESLSEEERQDIIEIDGRRYIRKVYEATHR